MRNRILYVFVTALLLIYSVTIQGQNIEDNFTMPQPPNTASFAKYGQYPVNLSSGLPDIMIPIYTIKSRQLELPISLTYHASGIKVNEKAGAVGLGWTLNAGGALTISVNGLSDIDSKYVKLRESDIDINNNSIYVTMSNIANGISDAYHDIYSYSVPGHISGSFTYGYEGNLIQLPETDNRIEKTAQGFTITSENGIQYFFDNKNKAISRHATTSSTNGLYLTKILSADTKDSINFEYQDYLLSLDNSASFMSSKSICEKTYWDHDKYCYGGLTINRDYLSYKEPVIKRISFNNGEIIFNTDSQREDKANIKISEIRVNKYNNDESATENILSCEFIYDYFISDGIEKASDFNKSKYYRLKLSNLKLKPSNTENPQYYSFYYNEVNLPNYELGGSTTYEYPYYLLPYPPKLGTYGQDMWGYYNGTENAHLLMPLKNSSLEHAPATKIYEWEFLKMTGSIPNRNISEKYTKACSLEKIVFPTGGSTLFEMESNEVNGIKKGGLRIKRISSYDSDFNLSEEKEYEYLVGHDLSLSSLTPDFSAYTQAYKYQVGDMKYDIQQILVTATPFYNQVKCESPIYYSKIAEYDGNRFNNSGKTIYVYNYDDNEIDYVSSKGSAYPKYYLTYIDNFWRRGHLLEKYVYKSIDGTSSLLEMQKNNYRLLREKKKEVIGLVVTRGLTYPSSITHSPNINEEFNWFEVYTNSGVHKLISTETTHYNEGGRELVEFINYYYDKATAVNNPHLQLTKTTTVNSNGDSIITKYNYPQDYEYKSTAHLDYSVNNSFRKNNIYNQPFEILKYTKPINAESHLRSGVFYKFKGINQLGEILKMYESPSIPYQGASYIDKDGYNINPNYKTEVAYTYNPVNHVREIKNKDNLSTTIIWGYRNMYPVAVIKNISSSVVSESLNNLDKLENSNSPDMLKIKELKDNQLFKDTHFSLYNYAPLQGLSSITDILNQTIHYEYNSWGQLAKITDNNSNLISANDYSITQSSVNKMDVTLNTQSVYYQYKTEPFHINVRNGPGDISYKWDLKNSLTNEILSSYAGNNNTQFNAYLKDLGNMTLTCSLEDKSRLEKIVITRLFKVIPSPKLAIKKITPLAQKYEYDSPITFSVETTGGTGDLKYLWTLIDPSSKVIFTTTDSIFTKKLSVSGKFKIICKVEDFGSKEILEKNETFEVKDPSGTVGFENISDVTYTTNNHTMIIKAKINCTENSEIEFEKSFQLTNNTSITYSIDNNNIGIANASDMIYLDPRHPNYTLDQYNKLVYSQLSLSKGTHTVDIKIVDPSNSINNNYAVSGLLKIKSAKSNNSNCKIQEENLFISNLK